MSIAVLVFSVVVPSAGVIEPTPLFAIVREAVLCAKFAVTVPSELRDAVVVRLDALATDAPPETVQPVKW